jgi:hypothetical protein
VAQAIETGRVEETIYFAAGEQPRLTYALVCDTDLARLEVRNTPTEVTVSLPQETARAWAQGEQVGIYATIDLGLRGTLAVSVEKDFACMDGSHDADAFPNPKAAAGR